MLICQKGFYKTIAVFVVVGLFLLAGVIFYTIKSSKEYGSIVSIKGDIVYYDNSGKMWTKTSQERHAWGPEGQFANSCTGGGPDYPACNYCDTLIYAGYSDWRLPSCDGETRIECEIYRFGLDACGEYPCAPEWDDRASLDYYWSSSEYDDMNARCLYVGSISPGMRQQCPKWQSHNVRCVRL